MLTMNGPIDDIESEFNISKQESENIINNNIKKYNNAVNTINNQKPKIADLRLRISQQQQALQTGGAMLNRGLVEGHIRNNTNQLNSILNEISSLNADAKKFQSIINTEKNKIEENSRIMEEKIRDEKFKAEIASMLKTQNETSSDSSAFSILTRHKNLLYMGGAVLMMGFVSILRSRKKTKIDGVK